MKKTNRFKKTTLSKRKYFKMVEQHNDIVLDMDDENQSRGVFEMDQ